VHDQGHVDGIYYVILVSQFVRLGYSEKLIFEEDCDDFQSVYEGTVDIFENFAIQGKTPESLVNAIYRVDREFIDRFVGLSLNISRVDSSEFVRLVEEYLF
jgi:hypothetical protein